MDLEQLLNSVQQISPVPWRVDGIIRRIQHELTKAEFILEHCYREINLAVDALAKQATSTHQSSMYDAVTLPRRVKGISCLDVNCFPYIRRINVRE